MGRGGSRARARNESQPYHHLISMSGGGKCPVVHSKKAQKGGWESLDKSSHKAHDDLGKKGNGEV